MSDELGSEYKFPTADARLNRWNSLSRLANLVLMVLLVVVTTAYLTKSPTDQECGNRTQVWSPLQHVVEYESYDFDNAFAHQTIYRGPPTPELEEAWSKLWYCTFLPRRQVLHPSDSALDSGIRIPEDKLPLLNRTVNLGDGKTLRPVTDGSGGYHAMVEVFHQLHCLVSHR